MNDKVFAEVEYKDGACIRNETCFIEKGVNTNEQK